MKPRTLVIAGFGLNCEDETLHAFEAVGAAGEIVHINDLIASVERLYEYQILALPGGFSYGDDTGSGNALASRLRHNLWERLQTFIDSDRLVIGICNGCQTLANLGLVPALNGHYGERNLALMHNANDRYQCRWVDTKVESTHCVWTEGIENLSLPVAHGEGRFAMEDSVLKEMKQSGHIVLRYIKPDGTPAQGAFPYNPNGSSEDIAGITDSSGRILALMPHPERSIYFHQLPAFRREISFRNGNNQLSQQKTTVMKLFYNAVEYFA